MHVVTCRSPSALELRETQLQELQLRLRSRNTDPIITSFLITGIRSCFHCDALFHQCHTGNPTTFRALKEELDIGWFALLCGYITSDFSHAQHRYFRTTHRKRHGYMLAKQLSIKQWALTFNVWKHRNQILHETDIVHSLSGMELLRSSITAKYNLGQDELPMPYSPLFYQPLILQLRKSHTYLKRWFVRIRARRESHYDRTHQLLMNSQLDRTFSFGVKTPWSTRPMVIHSNEMCEPLNRWTSLVCHDSLSLVLLSRAGKRIFNPFGLSYY